MKKAIPVLGAVAATLAFAPAAGADVPAVFGGVTCQTRPAEATVDSPTGGTIPVGGQRWCGTTRGTTVPTWDGTPIDVQVTLPAAPTTGDDGDFPVVGVFHGYGGEKLPATSAIDVQRWVQQGYAVFSMTDRGFGASCGARVPAPKPAACANGYIHLMSNAYEVRDAQHLLGLLADEGVIDPQRIGATGGSYGGGISLQLGALKDRVELPDGTLRPWTSPKGTAMRIAATAPEYGWSDLATALQPNGSTLDYAANNTYQGPKGTRRFGVMKYTWNTTLFTGGQQSGFYAPRNADPKANIAGWFDTNVTGGPYDGKPRVEEQLAELPHHGAAATDDSEAPAPALISNGWNDDLFPVDEAVRYYNQVRRNHPDAPISMVHLDFGHPNRAVDLRNPSPIALDAKALQDAENRWFAHYVRGAGDAPADAVGGVTAVTSACSGGTPTRGTTYRAANWAALSPGEVRASASAAQTIAPDAVPAVRYSAEPPSADSPTPSNPTVCTTAPRSETAGAAGVTTEPAPAGGYTLLGSPTIVADLTVRGANDQVVGRLLDVAPDGTTRLISRGTYRPVNVGATSRQVFQLHPQAWNVAEGHVLRLELLAQDFPYAQIATGQQPVGVANLDLRLPTHDAPGAAGGLVTAPAADVLPDGYEHARDAAGDTVVLPAETKPGGSGTGGGSAGGGATTTPQTPILPGPPPIDLPAPTKKDPVSRAASLKVLRKAPKGIVLSKSRTTLRFADALPQAGRVSYRLTTTVRTKGKRRTVTLGSVSATVKKGGTFKVTIKIGKAGRQALRANPKATLTLRTTFVTGVEKRKLTVVRKLVRK
ncbi:CocE/NonD family hydrolase [Patulibacter sp. SYSU D01012]|uniref:CocE/NonD family hydrolase n=1 Tax=Patulibacter sp. SYSU D01012 TaxID=2817381 RepID=UPI001B313067|nr:CocE/NonD family hydrolase [Patulibacter sp. SYSU D01012]